MSTCAGLRRPGWVGHCRRRWMTGRWNAFCFHPRAPGGARVPDWSAVHRELKRPGVTPAIVARVSPDHPHGYQYTWFQSTRPRRGAIRAGEKLFVDYASMPPEVSIHAPPEGRDAGKHFPDTALGVSIHAMPRPPGPRVWQTGSAPTCAVLPTSVVCGMWWMPLFQFTRPREQGAIGIAKGYRTPRLPGPATFQSTRPRRGAYRWWSAGFLPCDGVSATYGELNAIRVSIHAPPEGRATGYRPCAPCPSNRTNTPSGSTGTSPYRLSRRGARPLLLNPRAPSGVRITANTIECFHRGQRIASHRRSCHKAFQSTRPMPESHRQAGEWIPATPGALGGAGRAGYRNPYASVSCLFQSTRPRRGAILRLGKTYGSDRHFWFQSTRPRRGAIQKYRIHPSPRPGPATPRRADRGGLT